MDLFTRFNRKSIDDRQIDTLIGLSKGFLADGAINQSEAEFLLTWLGQNRAASNNPVVSNLFNQVASMLQDSVLDPDEAVDLMSTLRGLSGEESVSGELAKATTLPIDLPVQSIVFPSRKFLLTGTFAFGTRKQCEDAIQDLGGMLASSVTKNLDYLVVGTYVTDSWAHETFGRKIQKAVEYREQGVPLVIVTEEHWATEGRFTI